MKQGRGKVGLQRSHVALPVEEDRHFSAIGNMQRHETHGPLIAIEIRPALRNQNDAQGDGQRDEKKRVHTMLFYTQMFEIPQGFVNMENFVVLQAFLPLVVVYLLMLLPQRWATTATIHILKHLFNGRQIRYNRHAYKRSKKEESNVTNSRARIYDVSALLTAVLVIVLDQWTKALVVEHLGPPEFGPQIHLVGQYLILYYIRNNGAAFSLFANSIVLVVLIVAAIAVISYLYLRMLNSGPLAMKLIFGMIIGGAVGNLIDRARHGGNVVDFISFRIPQIGFYFAIFNIADAAISVGIFLLFVSILFGGMRRCKTPDTQKAPADGQGNSLENQQRSTPFS